MKTRFGLLLTMFSATMALAQTPPHPLKSAVKILTDTKPVTRDEARETSQKVRSALWHGLHLSGSIPATTIAAGSAPVSREAVILELDSTFEGIHPQFKFTPPRVGFDPKRFTITTSPEKEKLAKLVGWGAVAKVGPLAAGKSHTLTPQQFGDAVGFFMVRIADLTHVPYSRWTPYLNGGRS